MNDNKQNPYVENYMVSFDLARQLIREHSSSLGTEVVKLADLSGRVLTQEIVAPMSIPSFDNSAMDGFAVNYQDLQNASKKNPVKLQVAGLTAAGDGVERQTETGNTAWKIMTGAAVPEGYDSIIPVEETSMEGDIVSCFASPSNGVHIRRSGEDFEQGRVITPPRKIVDANAVMAFAALGLAELEVVKTLNIAVFATGKELVDDPSVELKPGQIRNSNTPYILEWFKDLPVEVYNAGTNLDQTEVFEKALQQELDKKTTIIISSGAVSMGDFDFIPHTIKKLGGEIIFHKSKIRPGKPILFARFPNGTFYFGLPGNPISAAIGLRFFVSELIFSLLGLPREKSIKAVAINGLKKKQGFRAILKAKWFVDEQGACKLEALKGQESFKIQPLLNANGWVMIEEDKDSFESGDVVDFYPSAISWNY